MEFFKRLFKKSKNKIEEIKEEKEKASTSLEKYCDENPESTECRIYDV